MLFFQYMCRNKGWNTCRSKEGKSSRVSCVDALLVDQLFSDFSWWDCFIFWWYYICLRGHSFYFSFQEILHFALINEISCITESWIWVLSIYFIDFQHFKKRKRILIVFTFCIFIFYNKSAFFILKRVKYWISSIHKWLNFLSVSSVWIFVVDLFFNTRK